jgi:CBS domain-containing protein
VAKNGQSVTRRSRSALAITDTELRLIAALAIIIPVAAQNARRRAAITELANPVDDVMVTEVVTIGPDASLPTRPR